MRLHRERRCPILRAMSTANDVWMSPQQASEMFGVSLAAVRAWILADKLLPVAREGRGRNGGILVAKGDVSRLVHGQCPTCGAGFKRTKIGQDWCSRLCRDRYRRAQARRPVVAG
jgi:hypothetical protein